MVKFQGTRELGSIVEFVEKKVLYPDHTASCNMIKKNMNDPNFKKHMVVLFGSDRTLVYEDFLQGIKEDKSNTVWIQNFDHNCA